MMMKILMFAISLAVFMPVAADTWTDPDTGVEWYYEITGGAVCLGGDSDLAPTAVSTSTRGDVVIPSFVDGREVVRIGDCAFYRCDNITSIEIPSCVKEIGRMAFYKCQSIEEIRIPDGVETIGHEAFWFCRGLKKVVVPASVTEIGTRAFIGCSSVQKYEVSSNNPYYSVKDGCLCDKSGKVLLQVKHASGTLVIPYGVESFDLSVLWGCMDDVSAIEIPPTVLAITKDDLVVDRWAYVYDGFGSGKIYVGIGDAGRMSGLFSAIGLDVSRFKFVEKKINGSASSEIDSGYFGLSSHTLNGLAYDSTGDLVGMVQISTTKASKKGVKVSGSVIFSDGKKQTLKSVTVPVVDGVLKFSTKVGKVGDADITVGENSFSGTLGNISFFSANVDENTGIIRSTVKIQYFDAKTGKIKSKSIKMSGVTSGGVAMGSLTAKGAADKSFEAVIK